MKALKICHNTHNLIKKNKILEVEVHSVFNRTCNIITMNNTFIPLLSHSLPPAPGGIVIKLPQDKSFESLKIKKGMRGFIEERKIKIGYDFISFDLTEAEIWDGGLINNFKRCNQRELEKKATLFIEMLLREGNFNGIAPIIVDIEEHFGIKREVTIPHNHYSGFIVERMIKLIDTIKAGTTKDIKRASKGIVGFGPGLTPATDDFLTGFIMAILYLSIYKMQNIKDSLRIAAIIVEDVRNRTTRVSAEMLQYASKGEVIENVRSFIINLLSESSQEAMLEGGLSVINNGETSGTDLLAGVYIGYLFAKQYESEGEGI